MLIPVEPNPDRQSEQGTVFIVVVAVIMLVSTLLVLGVGGFRLLDNGDREGARASFERALQADPNDFEANLYLGGMLRYDGNLKEATPYLEKARMLRPASVEARYQIGLLKAASGRLEDGLSDLEKVERETPEFKEVHVQLAALYARMHRLKDSERERALVVQLDEKAREQAPHQAQP